MCTQPNFFTENVWRMQTLKRSYLMAYTYNPLTNRKITSNVCLIKNSIFRLLGTKVYLKKIPYYEGTTVMKFNNSHKWYSVSI